MNYKSTYLLSFGLQPNVTRHDKSVPKVVFRSSCSFLKDAFLSTLNLNIYWSELLTFGSRC